MAVAKHAKIYAQFISEIKLGTLKPGDKISSTRETARLYRCHRFTVMNAMQALVAEGWLEVAAKSHYFVSSRIPVTTSAGVREKKKKEFTVQSVRPMPPFDLERTRYRLEFWGGQPDLRLFPVEEFRKTISDSMKRLKSDQLSYGPVDGLGILKQEIAGYLRRSRSMTGKEYLVTNGSQEALYLIAQVFIKPGDKIAIERKGYPPAWKLFESLGAKLVPIEVDEQGMDTDHLTKVLRNQNIKMIYTTPLHQYPTTVTLSPRRRQALVQIAESHQIPILEDDYDNEFHYVGPPPPPLAVETNYAIYICSFSKLLFPGARLGVIACSSDLKDQLAYQKYLVSRQTECLTQLGLARWMKDGGFEKHVRRMRRIYETRYNFMEGTLQRMKNDFEVEWSSPNGGMSIWLDLKRDSAVLAERAKKLGVFFQAESTMDYALNKGSHLRIGFAGVNETQIEEGLGVLTKLLHAKPRMH